VKNEKIRTEAGCDDGPCENQPASIPCDVQHDSNCGSGDLSSPEVAQSARIASSNQAGFNAESHVTATCGKKEKAPNANNQLRGKELIEWALGNYTVDPVQNSKNRWKIRLRCRKTGCNHEGHLKIKTVSFMSDSGYKSAIRGSKKHASWKKQIIAENARALRKSD